MKPQPKTLVWLAALLLWSYGVHRIWSRYAPPVPSRVVELGGPRRVTMSLKDGQLVVCHLGIAPDLSRNPARHGHVQNWDLKTGKMTNELLTPADTIILKWPNAGIWLSQLGQEFRVFDMQTGNLLDTIQSPVPIQMPSVSPDRRTLAVPTDQGLIVRDTVEQRELWSNQDGRNPEFISNSILTVNTVHHRNAEGQISGSSNRLCFDATTGEPVKFINQHGSVQNCTVTPDGRHLLCLTSAKGLLSLFNLVDKTLVWETGTLPLQCKVFDNETMVCRYLSENRVVIRRMRLDDQSVVEGTTSPDDGYHDVVGDWKTNGEYALFDCSIEHWSTRSVWRDEIFDRLEKWFPLERNGERVTILCHSSTGREIARHPESGPFCFVDDHTYAAPGVGCIEYYNIPPRRDPWWLWRPLVATAVPVLIWLGVAKWWAGRKARQLARGAELISASP